MRRDPALAVYDQLEDTLASIPRLAGSAPKISAELRSVLLEELGLVASIEWHARQFRKSTGIPCDVDVRNATRFALPESYVGRIFDIYNEAVRSAARHAGASRVAVALTITPREVSMIVRDDGAGSPVTVSLPIA